MSANWHDLVFGEPGGLNYMVDNNASVADIKSAVSTALGAGDVLTGTWGGSSENRIAQVNNADLPFSAMGQADLGLFCINFAKNEGLVDPDRSWFVDRGVQMLRVITSSKSNDGLRSNGTGNRVFIHSRTSGDNSDSIETASTLNQGLSAARDLVRAHDSLVVLGLATTDRVEFRDTAKNYCRQLSSGSNNALPPNIYDYIPRNNAGDARTGVPVYYYAKPSSSNGAWPNGSDNGWLDDTANTDKNAGYHVRDMKMIHALAGLLGTDFPLTDFQADTVSWYNRSPLQHLFDVYKNKIVAWKSSFGWPSSKELDSTEYAWYQLNAS